jgi:predicted nucleic acid-binding Zn ribbon protein
MGHKYSTNESYTKEKCLDIIKKHRKTVQNIMEIFFKKVKTL